MVTRAKTSKIEAAANIAATLVPRDIDIKFTGGEPQFIVQPSEANRKIEIISALNWYSRFYDRKSAIDQFIQWVENRYPQPQVKTVVKTLKSVQPIMFNPSVCWLARLNLRGLILTEQEGTKLVDEVNKLLLTVNPAVETSVEETVIVSNRPNVQEIMRERAREAAGELEGVFDDFLVKNDPQPQTVNVVGVLTERNILPQHVPMIVDVWKKKRDEIELVQEGKDRDLKEGYSQYTKISLRNMVKFCDAVLSGLNSYISVKKTNKVARKRKPVSPEKLASKVKFLREFKDTANKLDLTSVAPSKIVGANEVWAYDTAKRKLHYYVTDSHSGSLTVKGSSIIGFDASQSGMKTLRKPSEVLNKIMALGKPACRKLFKEINSVQASVKGRTSESFIILKAY